MTDAICPTHKWFVSPGLTNVHGQGHTGGRKRSRHFNELTAADTCAVLTRLEAAIKDEAIGVSRRLHRRRPLHHALAHGFVVLAGSSTQWGLFVFVAKCSRNWPLW